MKRIIILSVITLMFIGIFSTCKKNKDGEEVFPPANPVLGVYRGNIPNDFSETDSRGLPINLESLRGKVILLTFSTMWCGPCRRETPELVNLFNTYQQRGLEIVQCIFEDEDGNPADPDDLARWINEFGINFTVFNDPDFSTVLLYKISPIPLNVIIGRDFIIWYRIEGAQTDKVRQCIEELL